jgi:hypothetical protein
VGDGGDIAVFIINTDDILKDGSFIHGEDADALIDEVEQGFSWHWWDAIGVDENNVVHL